MKTKKELLDDLAKKDRVIDAILALNRRLWQSMLDLLGATNENL